MKPKEYEKNVLVTESCDFAAIRTRTDDRMIRLLHSGLGMSSELAELEVALDKTDWDLVNISEESGDILWYIAVAVNALGFDHNEISSFEVSKKEGYALRDSVNTTVWAVGEFNDLLKKHLFYGRELNTDKLKQNLQQMCMAVSAICIYCDKTPGQTRETNIAKLKVRFKDKFTEAAALNRDLDTERKILEGEKV